MNLLSTVIINIIIMTFPLMVYLLYTMDSRNIQKKGKEIFLDFALISSLYLLITYNKELHPYFVVLLNIPLLIAYIKKHNLMCIVMTIIIIFCYNQTGLYNFLLTVALYLIFYLIFYYYKVKKISIFKLVNIFLIIETIFMFSNLIITNASSKMIFLMITMLIILILITYLTIYIYKKAEEVVNLFMNIKEFEYNKQYRTSLFKITHEIKNPIAVCKTYLDMFDFNNKSHTRYIPIIKEEINKILVLLQDFLSMNKIKIEQELLDIVFLIEESTFCLEPLLKEKTVNLKSELIDDEIFINGDYNRLHQVIINIIKNAIEADSTNLNIEMKLMKDNIKIIFEDNGIGMNEEVLKRVKEPFYTTKKNGTGLGVSLSNEIIEAHKGTILYNSKENSGTRVEIILPLLKI